jgi:hypothetical protein
MFNITISVINNNEVITCAFIFVKENFHCVKMRLNTVNCAFRVIKKTKICKTKISFAGCKDMNLLFRHINCGKQLA